MLKIGLRLDDGGDRGGLVRTMGSKALLPWARDPVTTQKDWGPQDSHELLTVVTYDPV